MAITVWGIVKEGLVVPQAPLPEGTRVQIVLPDGLPGVPPELQAELDAWDRASAGALELIERLAREGDAHEERWNLAGSYSGNSQTADDLKGTGFHLIERTSSLSKFSPFPAA